MSSRFSASSLHLIRTIASFFSSVFVCQRYGASDRSTSTSTAAAAAALKESSESRVECGGDSSSSRSSSSSSISSSLRYSSSSCDFSSGGTNGNCLRNPTIVLTTPSGHRHCKSSRSQPKSQNSRSLASRLRLSAHLADICNVHSDNDDLSDSSFDDEENDLEDMEAANRLPEKVKVTEKELSHLNRKIEKLLLKLDEEYETEIATSPDEECVICISAKATMQTFPCGHRVVCRKCFVKTIQMVVTQRMLPLRCVICRAKVLKLKQTTTGGLSTGFVRSNSKHQSHHFGGGSVCRPASLVLPASELRDWATHLLPDTPTRAPISPLTEVFQAQKALYELQYRVVNPLGKPYSESELEHVNSSNGNLVDNGDDPDNPIGEPLYDAAWDTSMRVSRRLQQYFLDCANNNSNANRELHSAARRHLESLRCNTCGSSPVTTVNGKETFHPSLVNSVGSSHQHICDWVDKPTTEQQQSAEPACDPNHNVQYHSPTSVTPPAPYLLPWSLHRKRKHARYLQHRRWPGVQSQRLPLQLLNAQQQQFFQLPVGLLEQPLAERSQEICQHAVIQVQDLDPWQRPQHQHSLLLPISEEDEERVQWEEEEEEEDRKKLPQLETPENFSELIGTTAATTSTLTPYISTLGSSTSHSHNSHILQHNETNKSAFSKHPKKGHRKCRTVQIRKSRSESFLASRYKRLNDNSVEENGEETALTEPNSDVESDQEPSDGLRASRSKGSSKNLKLKPGSTLSSRLKQSSSSLGLSSLISSTIQESVKMFRSLKLH